MVHELRTRNQSQQLFVRALSQAYRNGIQLYDPSIWLVREPEIEEKMLRDADIRHAIGYRRHLIAGRSWTITPTVEGSPRSDVAVHVATELLKHIEHFTRARLNLSRAFFSGARFSRIHGEPMDLPLGDGRVRTWWVPTSLEDQDKRMYRIATRNEDNVIHTHWERWNIGASEFESLSPDQFRATLRHVYEDDQAALGHGTALREALGWWWYAKTHVFQESLQAVERFAQGIIHARIDGVRDADGKPNTQLIAEWQEVLEDLRSRHVLVSDKNDIVEVISGSSEGHQLLSDIRAELRNTIYTLVMGANLTTAASEGGSYALAEVQENSTEALLRYDRETLQEMLSAQLIAYIWRMNWPNLVELDIARERPNFSIAQEKIMDPKERAAIGEIANRMGVRLSRDDFLDQIGFRIPKEGEDTIDPVIIPGGVNQNGTLFSDLGMDDAFTESGDGVASLDAPSKDTEIQDTALNGAQVSAAAEIIDRVVSNTLPPNTAILMLTSMFSMDHEIASKMVTEAAAFNPATPVDSPAEAALMR